MLCRSSSDCGRDHHAGVLIAHDSRVRTQVKYHNHLLRGRGASYTCAKLTRLASKEELTATVQMVRPEMQAMETRHNQRVQFVANDVL